MRARGYVLIEEYEYNKARRTMAVSAPQGNRCVATSATIGAQLISPDGTVGRVTSLYGTSPQCSNPATPMLAAGISGATSHSGRRTGLTNLAERGVGVRTLMALAGHSNMATTQRYIDLRPAMLKAAGELV